MKAKYESSHIDTIEISIPAKPEFLKIFRAALSSVCEVRGFCKDDLNNVILAVDESCSNIIRHAYGGPTEKPIKAKIYICSEKIEIYLKQANYNFPSTSMVNARTNVQKRIKTALEHIHRACPELREYLNNRTITTGQKCIYESKLSNPVQWNLDPLK